MLSFLLGIIKGAVVGGVVGAGAQHLGFGGSWGYLLYGAIAAAVGLVAGRPFWVHLHDPSSTIFTAFLKSIVGFGVGAGLFALAHSVLHDPTIAALGQTHRLTEWTPIFGAAVGAVYGAWIEIDDAPAAAPPKA